MAIRDVLIVDDSPTMRTLIGYSLGIFTGVTYREAGNGVEALESMEEKRPDLLVVDVNMPGMNGFDLIRSVRRDDQSTPIVLLTIQGSDDDVKQGLQAGATEYLVKPFQPHKLQAIVHRLDRE